MAKLYKLNKWWDDLDNASSSSRFLYFIFVCGFIWSIPLILQIFGITYNFIHIIPFIIFIPALIIRLIYLNNGFPKE